MGDVAALLNDTPAARELIRFLATPEAAESWVKAGGFISPNTQVDVGDYPDAMTQDSTRTPSFRCPRGEPSPLSGSAADRRLDLAAVHRRAPPERTGIACTEAAEGANRCW